MKDSSPANMACFLSLPTKEFPALNRPNIDINFLVIGEDACLSDKIFSFKYLYIVLWERKKKKKKPRRNLI